MDARSLAWSARGTNAARVLRHARDSWFRRARRHSAARGQERARIPGSLLEAEPAPGGGLVRFVRSTLRIRVAVGGAVFLGWDGAEPEPSYALVEGCPPVDQRATLEPDTNGGWRVVSERTLVVITRYGSIEVRTPGGALLRRDLPPRWWETAGADDAHWALTSEVAADAGFFGQGGWAAGPCLPDGGYRLWNESFAGRRDGALTSGAAMPTQLVVAGSGGHLVFYDSAWEGEFRLREGTVGEGSGHDRPGRSRLAMSGGPIRYWVIPGAPARVLRGWSQLTGAAAIAPDWALGYQHAVQRWSSGELGELAASFGRHGLRLRGLHLGAGRGQHPVDQTASTHVAELSAVAADLSRTGAGVVQGLTPVVASAPGEEWFECGRSTGLLLSEGAPGSEPARAPSSGTLLPDFTEPRARKWWGRLYQPYLDLGVRGFGHEPLGRDVRTAGAGGPPRQARYALEGRGGDHREAHNVWPLAMASAGYEAVQAARPSDPPLVLSSSAWAGLQRYGGVCAPVLGDWAGLRAALTTVLGLGLSGVPLAGVDVGGARGRLSPELYLRWFQLASLLPVFRTRSTSHEAREPWRYGDDVAAAAVTACARRERLLPYLVTLAHQASATGVPMARPLWWQTPLDRGLRAVDDAFLLGDALLVAPVLEAGVARRTVRLPPGGWYDTSTGEAHRGPGWLTMEAPLSTVPVLARAGSVIPLATVSGEVELEVWPPLPGRAGGGVVAVGERARERELRRLSVRADSASWRVTWGNGEPVDYPVLVRGVSG